MPFSSEPLAASAKFSALVIVLVPALAIVRGTFPIIAGALVLARIPSMVLVFAVGHVRDLAQVLPLYLPSPQLVPLCGHLLQALFDWYDIGTNSSWSPEAPDISS